MWILIFLKYNLQKWNIEVPFWGPWQISRGLRHLHDNAPLVSTLERPDVSRVRERKR